MDLFGPNHYSTISNEASQYGFVIVDDYSRYTWVHLVTYKHEVQEVNQLWCEDQAHQK